MVPLPFEAFGAFRGLLAPPGAGQAGKPLAPRPKNPWPGALGWGALGPGPLARKTLGLGPFGLGGPWLWKWGASLEWGTLGSEPLGVGGPWPGGPWLGAKSLLGGPCLQLPLGPGALAGRKSPKSQEKFENHEIEQPACLDPLASLLVQESSHQGPGGPGQGVPANPEPKTLNRPPETKGSLSRVLTLSQKRPMSVGLSRTDGEA